MSFGSLAVLIPTTGMLVATIILWLSRPSRLTLSMLVSQAVLVAAAITQLFFMPQLFAMSEGVAPSSPVHIMQITNYIAQAAATIFMIAFLLFALHIERKPAPPRP